jgi:hypothetical protein
MPAPSWCTPTSSQPVGRRLEPGGYGCLIPTTIRDGVALYDSFGSTEKTLRADLGDPGALLRAEMLNVIGFLNRHRLVASVNRSATHGP